MKTVFVDTNYFLRFLLDDLPDQRREVVGLFKQAMRGKVQLFTSTVVFFEIFWVLKNSYKKSRGQVVYILEELLSLDFVQVADKQILIAALALSKVENVEFEDCYNIAYANNFGADQIATFDQSLAKVAKRELSK